MKQSEFLIWSQHLNACEAYEFNQLNVLNLTSGLQEIEARIWWPKGVGKSGSCSLKLTGLIDEWLKIGVLEQSYKTQVSDDYLNKFKSQLKAFNFWTLQDFTVHPNIYDQLIHFEGLKANTLKKTYQRHRIESFDSYHTFYPLKKLMLTPFENILSEKIKKAMN